MNYLFTNTAGAAEPVTLTEVKSYLKIDYSADDALMTLIISAARQAAEKFCNRSFISKTIEFTTEVFDLPVLLPFPNHGVITSVKLDDVATTDYTVIGLTQFRVTVIPLVYIEDGLAPSELTVTYTAGLTAATAEEKFAILKVIADMYRNRDESGMLSENAMSYLQPLKVYQ